MAFFSLTSSFGRFLQAHTDGETHASNDHRGNEETWILIPLNSANGLYAIRNARNFNLLTFEEAGCIRANQDQAGPAAQWFFIEIGGNQFRVKSARTDFVGFLGAQAPGHDTNCGGEVQALLDTVNPDKTVWELRQHATDSDPGGGIDIGQIVGTVAGLASLFV